MYLYSETTKGFYSKEIHGNNMPDDVIEITAQEHAELMNAQSDGKIIVFNQSTQKPEAIHPPAPSQTQQFENVRQALQAAIDTQARGFGFSSGNALILYAGFTNAFQTLAQTFASWEVSVWVQAEAYKAQVIANAAPMLTPEQAVEMMPTYPA